MDGDGFGYFQIRLEKGYLEFRPLKKLEEILSSRFPMQQKEGDCPLPVIIHNLEEFHYCLKY
ncbi:hypothetical protein [Candidatus Nitrosocosmicus hydrocola]|uniref:hypothetical protein n=1 Tax=Candidatus Nitrosocosmicus hydrocola TaxID=1826872 RepID=UPI0013733E3F|nr:hypothetical protein [Candidatus Nitrosocosmicus hydrocola]